MTVSEIELHDRPSFTENILAGTLLFDDGSAISVPLEAASFSMDSELSRPVISAAGHRPVSTAVLFPGPHPRSTAVCGLTPIRFTGS